MTFYLVQFLCMSGEEVFLPQSSNRKRAMTNG